jgi:hypothetical protein
MCARCANAVGGSKLRVSWSSDSIFFSAMVSPYPREKYL